MRILVVFIAMTFSLLLGAQTLKQDAKDSIYLHHTQGRKWLFTPYSNLGMGVTFMNGGNGTVVSAPVGLQLSRQLSDNLYAFTGVSLGPTYVNFNRSFLSPASKPYMNNGFKSEYFGMYPSVNAGLMYVNDARTFSVSGSIGIQRSNYPTLYSPASVQRINTVSQTPVYR